LCQAGFKGSTQSVLYLYVTTDEWHTTSVA